MFLVYCRNFNVTVLKKIGKIIFNKIWLWRLHKDCGKWVFKWIMFRSKPVKVIPTLDFCSYFILFGLDRNFYISKYFIVFLQAVRWLIMEPTFRRLVPYRDKAWVHLRLVPAIPSATWVPRDTQNLIT